MLEYPCHTQCGRGRYSWVSLIASLPACVGVRGDDAYVNCVTPYIAAQYLQILGRKLAACIAVALLCVVQAAGTTQIDDSTSEAFASLPVEVQRQLPAVLTKKGLA